MLADLWNSPEAANTIGGSTTGSSEAAMLGGMAMKRSWEAKRKAAGKSFDKPNRVTGPVQVCWRKFARASSLAIGILNGERFRWKTNG